LQTEIFEGWGRMASVENYLQYAEQCVALAAKSSNPGDKARLLQMAQAWRDLSTKRDDDKKEDPV
jgi:hypothetical protein